jgi:hypothetical protein
MNKSYTPTEYVAELERQLEQLSTLTTGLSDAALNWQPNAQSWSIGQCLDHLVRTNDSALAAIRHTVESNRDELRTRAGEMQAAGWLSRWFVRSIGPDSNAKFRAPRKIVPVSSVTSDVLARFTGTQKMVQQFVMEFGNADLGALRYPNPLLPVVRWTVDSGLMILIRHNARHMQQAERVKESPGFPR